MANLAIRINELISSRLNDNYEDYMEDPAYIALQDAAKEAYKALRETLTPEQEGLLLAYEAKESGTDTYIMEKAYESGLKDGIALQDMLKGARKGAGEE